MMLLAGKEVRRRSATTPSSVGPMSPSATATFNRICLVSAAFLACHIAAITLLPAHAMVLSFPFLIAAPLIAALSCWVRASRTSSREGWISIGLAVSLWSAGIAATTYGTLVNDTSFSIDALSVSLFVLYGVPLIYVVAGGEGECWQVRIVDGVLALALGCMFLGHSFAFATLTGTSHAGMVSVRLLYDIENVFIAAFALVRFITATSRSQRSLFGALAIFAVAYMLIAGFINHFEYDTDYGTLTDSIIDLPFLLLAVLAISGRPAATAPQLFSHRIARLVRAASPLMLPATLLVVSGLLLKRSPHLALAGFLVASLVSGVRNVIVQMRSYEEHDELDELARVDALTGLANRREFDAGLQAEWDRARRRADSLALLMIDIDHFKALNDAFGHLVGDQRLRDVANALHACATRSSDLVARYGGEEFVILLPAARSDNVRAVAEAMRTRITALRLPSPSAIGIVTVSIGVGYIGKVTADCSEALLAAADAALYEAKGNGRNCVAVQSLPSENGGFLEIDRSGD